MNPQNPEIKFYSIQFGKWALEHANKIWVDNYTVSMWLYNGKPFTTDQMYEEYLKTL